MLSGLMPSPGGAAMRGMVYGRSVLRAGGATAEGVSGRFGAGGAARAAS